MTPADQFYKALRDVFAGHSGLHGTQILALVAAVAVAIAFSVGLGRWRSRKRIADRINALAAGSGLTRVDLDYLEEIASSAGMPVLEVMTSVAPFEYATAGALAFEAPTHRPPPGSQFERVRRLRRALGFSPLSPHLWLLSTRELVEGEPVAVGGARGRVAEVNEASFAVDLPADAALTLGASAAVTIDRADDARYFVSVRLQAVEAPPGATAESGAGPVIRRAFYSHDEQPERQQQREYVRVRVQGSVVVRILDAARQASQVALGADPARAGAPEGAARTTITGALVDVSAGGLSLDLPMSPDGPLRRGARIQCSFTLGESEVFPELAALVVVATVGPLVGMQHVRLSFTSLSGAARERLAAAVSKHQCRPPP